MDLINNELVPLAPYWSVLMDIPSPLSYATEVTTSPQNDNTVTSLFCFLWGERENIESILIVQISVLKQRASISMGEGHGTFTYLCG